MKILHITCAGGHAGIPTVIRSLSQAWAQAGHSSDVISLDKNEKKWLTPPGKLCSYRLAHSQWAHFLYKPWAKKILLKGQYDVILAHYPPLDHVFLTLAHKQNIRTGYFYHNVTEPKLYRGAERKRREIEDQILLSNLKNQDSCFVASQFSADKVIQKAKITPIVVPLGVDINFWETSKSPRKPFELVTVGKLYEHKGAKELIEAFRLAKQKIPQLTLKIIGKIGNHSYAQECLRLAPEGISFLGPISNQEMRKHFQTASLFVSATLYEGFGLSFLEAAACGLPTIGFDICSLPEVVKNKETGILVERGNLQKFSEAIIQLLENPKKRAAMQHEGSLWAKTFTWQRSSQLIMEHFLKFK